MRTPLSAAPVAAPAPASPPASAPQPAADAADSSPGEASAAPARSYLAFDFGTRRIGVASGNSVIGAGHPLRTLAAEGEARFVAIAALIAEWQPDELVVGLPLHPDGAEHEMTRRARRFANQLHGRFRLPVHAVDERYTSTAAEAAGARDVDAAAAAIILTQFLRAGAGEAESQAREGGPG